MTTRPMAGLLNPKGKAVTSLDVDRENFEKQQVRSLLRTRCTPQLDRSHVGLLFCLDLLSTIESCRSLDQPIW